jgi:predicted outer membrane protein
MKTLGAIIAALVLGASLTGYIPTASAQEGGGAGPAAQTRPIEPPEFVQLAYSSALLQEQAAKLAAGRDTRPEVKSAAAAAAESRTTLLHRLEGFAKERNIPIPAAMVFEHRVIIENLEPLNALELSRRYAEVQVQSLEQEINIYRAAGRSPDQGLKAFATQILPGLQQQLDDARTLFQSVRP